jgi:hypothetical protein
MDPVVALGLGILGGLCVFSEEALAWIPEELDMCMLIYVVAGIVAGLLIHRLSIGQSLIPQCLLSGPFPAMFITVLGCFTMQAFFEHLEGPATAWAPLVVLCIFTGIIAWRGSVAANGGGLGLAPYTPIILPAAVYLYTEFMKEKPAPVVVVTKKWWQLWKKAKRVVSVPQPDPVLEYAPIVIAAALVLTICLRLITHRTAFPKGMLQGSFPWSLLVGGTVWWLSDLCSFSMASGGSFGDWTSVFGLCIVSGVVARVGTQV